MLGLVGLGCILVGLCSDPVGQLLLFVVFHQDLLDITPSKAVVLFSSCGAHGGIGLLQGFRNHLLLHLMPLQVFQGLRVDFFADHATFEGWRIGCGGGTTGLGLDWECRAFVGSLIIVLLFVTEKGTRRWW